MYCCLLVYVNPNIEYDRFSVDAKGDNDTKRILGMFKIGICDDEKITCTEIEDIIHKFCDENGLQVETYVWYTGEMLCIDLKNKVKLDLLFLDIDLLSMTGVEVSEFIRKELEIFSIEIVYISSRTEYIMELFHAHPFNFLIKPLSATQIEENVREAIKTHKEKNAEFEYNIKGEFGRIAYRDIKYFSSDNKKINIIATKGPVTINGKLKEIVQILPKNFMQIHQSHVINIDYIDTCSYEEVRLKGEKASLNISRTYRKIVRDNLLMYGRRKYNGGDCF